MFSAPCVLLDWGEGGCGDGDWISIGIGLDWDVGGEGWKAMAEAPVVGVGDGREEFAIVAGGDAFECGGHWLPLDVGGGDFNQPILGSG